MFLLLNGSFGIGKTTVAQVLQSGIAGSTIYDPERIGFVLRRLPPFLLGRTKLPSDYQDLDLWRKLIARGARNAHRSSRLVIVPMAFTNLAYFEELVKSLSSHAEVQPYCLVAPLNTVRDRLNQRAHSEGRTPTDFELQRSAECIAAHADPSFGTPVDASPPPAEIAAHIRAQAGI
jgi:hypothetical protein